MAEPVYAVAIEFVSGSFTNVTSDVLRFNVERSLGTLLQPLRGGKAQVEFINESRRYSPGNADGAYFGMLLPNKRMKITATHSGTDYNLFYGWTTEFALNPMLGNKTAIVDATDVVQRLGNTTLTTSLRQNINPASLFCEVMSECSVASFASETLFDEMEFAYFRDLTATEALKRIVGFGRYSTFQDGAGTVQLKGRYFGLFNTSVATLVGGNNDYFSFDYRMNDRSVLNQVKIAGGPRKVATAVGTVAWAQEVLAIPASSGIGFWLSYVDPDQPGLFAPATSLSCVSSTDYRVNANSAGSGADRTATTSLRATFFGEAAVCSLFNGTGDEVFVTKFQLRGFSAQAQPPLAYETKDSSSQNVYGVHPIVIENTLMTKRLYAESYADSLKQDRKEVLPQLTIAAKNQYEMQLGFELGELVSLVESHTGVNSQWTIQRLTHDVTLANGLEHLTKVNVEFYGDKPWLVLDDAARGVLDGARVLAF